MIDVRKLGIAELLNGQECGAFSAKEIVEAFLCIIQEKEPTTQAFLSMDASNALKNATKVDEKRKKGDPLVEVRRRLQQHSFPFLLGLIQVVLCEFQPLFVVLQA